MSNSFTPFSWKIRSNAEPQNIASIEWLKWNYIINDVRDSDLNENSNQNKLDIDTLLLTKIDIRSLELPQDPRMKQWSIYQFAVHLYDKLNNWIISENVLKCFLFLISLFYDIYMYNIPNIKTNVILIQIYWRWCIIKIKCIK